MLIFLQEYLRDRIVFFFIFVDSMQALFTGNRTLLVNPAQIEQLDRIFLNDAVLWFCNGVKCIKIGWIAMFHLRELAFFFSSNQNNTPKKPIRGWISMIREYFTKFRQVGTLLASNKIAMT